MCIVKTPELAVVITAAVVTFTFMSALRLCFCSQGQAHAAKRWMIVSIYCWTALEWWVLLAWPPATAALQWAGVVLLIASLVVFLWSINTLRHVRPSLAFVEGAPVAMVMKGPYAYVRHPIYTSYLMAWLAAALATGQWWLLGAAIWMGYFYWKAALYEEEAFAMSAFSREYDAYRRRSGMLLPRLIRVTEPRDVS
jgi:protein-S-isoprenylcysteine O-methyltransferase Ste14